MRIAISGWYGARNLGDEAILSAMIETITSRIPGSEIHVFSKDPAQTASSHHVESSSSGLLALGKSAGILKDSDAFVLGGGGFLHKYSFSAFWMSRPTLALFMRVPVVFYSLGVDRTVLQSPMARWLIGRTANKAHLITVRDETSKDVLLRMGVRKPVHVTIDPVFGLKPPEEDTTKELLGREGLRSSGYVLLCPGLPGYSWGEIDSGEYEKALIGLVNHVLNELDTTVLLVPFKLPEDLDFCRRLKKATDNTGSVRVLEKHLSPKDVLGLFSECWFALCARYHGNIFAAISGVPFVSIMYIPKKHKPLLDQTGMTEFGLPIQEVSSPSLINTVSQLLESEKDVRHTLAEKRAMLEDKANRNVELFFDLAKDIELSD